MNKWESVWNKLDLWYGIQARDVSWQRNILLLETTCFPSLFSPLGTTIEGSTWIVYQQNIFPEYKTKAEAQIKSQEQGCLSTRQQMDVSCCAESLMFI